MTDPCFSIAPERPGDHETIELLLDEAFGLERRVKTAYRLREGSAPVRELCFTGRLGGRLVGTIQFWPIIVAHRWPALLLGPLAIAGDQHNRGFGLALMRHGLARAEALGHERVILVGDPPYYARAGFVPAPEGVLEMPGWVDPKRVLYRELVPGAMEGVSGLIASPVRSPALAVPGEAEQKKKARKSEKCRV